MCVCGGGGGGGGGGGERGGRYASKSSVSLVLVCGAMANGCK